MSGGAVGASHPECIHRSSFSTDIRHTTIVQDTHLAYSNTRPALPDQPLLLVLPALSFKLSQIRVDKIILERPIGVVPHGHADAYLGLDDLVAGGSGCLDGTRGEAVGLVEGEQLTRGSWGDNNGDVPVCIWCPGSGGMRGGIDGRKRVRRAGFKGERRGGDCEE